MVSIMGFPYFGKLPNARVSACRQVGGSTLQGNGWPGKNIRASIITNTMVRSI